MAIMKITTQEQMRINFYPPLGFEPWYPETESQCATIELG